MGICTLAERFMFRGMDLGKTLHRPRKMSHRKMGLEPLGMKFQHLKDPDCDGEGLLSALQTPHTAGRGMATVGSSEAGGSKQSPYLGFWKDLRICSQ